MRLALGVLLLAALLLSLGPSQAQAAETPAPPKLVTTEQCLAKIHTGNLTGSPRFIASPDNRHEAHPAALRNRPLSVSLDGQAYGPPLQGVLDGTLTFSPDSKRLAYVAGSARKGARVSMILDGVEGKQYDQIITLAFSPDSKRFAYLARQGKTWFAVVDGVEMKGYDDTLPPIAFDSSGAHIAYAAKSGEKHFIVADGKEGDPYDIAVYPVFSPDGARLAYLAKNGDESFVILDGVRRKTYDSLLFAPPVFSSDGAHLCYIAKRGEAWIVVADEVEGAPYEGITHPIYSPDSARLAYYARRGEGVFPVVDGIDGKPFDQTGPIEFSPDSRRLAYVGFTGEKPRTATIVVDGVPGPTYDSIFSIAFSPDSKRLAYLAKRGDKWIVVVDGAETKPYEGLFWGTDIIFDSPTHLHTLLRSGADLDPYCIDIEITD